MITLRESQEQIDFDLTIDWKNNVGIGEYKQGDDWQKNRRAFHDDRFKLNVFFPSTLTDLKIYKNAPFDVFESSLDNTFFNTWDNIKNNVILNWLDVSQGDGQYGLTLLSDHTTSYSHGKDYPLALTLQYSGKGLWWADYKITQASHIKYALIPHKGKWDNAAMHTASTKWNEPLVSNLSKGDVSADQSFVNINGAGYELTSMAQSAEGLTMRLFNAESDDSMRTIDFHFPISSVEEVELNGELVKQYELRKEKNKTSISVNIPRFGVRTFRIK